MSVVRSIRFRIVAGVALSLAVVLGAGSILLVDLVEARLIDEAQSSLQDALDELTGGEGNLVVPAESLLAVPGTELLVQLVDEGEEVIAAVIEADGGEAIAEIVVDPAGGDVIEVEEFEDGALDEVDSDDLADTVLDGVRTGDGQGLAVTTTFSSVRTSVSTLRSALWVLVPLMVLAGAGASWLWVGRSLRPVVAIGATAEGIGTDGLSGRVPVPSTGDEVERLARLINEMLGRIEADVDRRQQFVSDASHELRTPLATIRAGAEMLQLDGDASTAPVAADVMAEVDRLDALIGDLLALARLDQSDRSTVTLDLRQLVEGEIAHTGDGRIDLEDGPAVRVVGDAVPLERAVSNLLTNARRHAISGIEVAVSVTDDGTATVVVQDDGDGVSSDDRDRIFDRFVRLDGGRSRDGGGAGLGLAIVAGVAEAHGGSAAVTDRLDGRPGARFELRLPALPAGGTDTSI